MRDDMKWSLVAASAVLCLAIVPAQPADAAGKIVCWKDKSGKVVGCGDTVPPEYQTSATKELDSRGVTRKTTETAEEVAKRKEQEKGMAKQKGEEQKRLAEQRRQDTALLSTYTNEKEIDQRRDRDIQQVDLSITQLQAPLKNATDRYNDAKKRNAKDDITRAEAEKQKIEGSIAAREKEKADIRSRYDEQKKRYLELRGGTSTTAGTAPATTPAPKK